MNSNSQRDIAGSLYSATENPWSSALSRVGAGGALNTAFEVCGRWADRAGLPAMTVIDESFTPRTWSYKDFDLCSSKLSTVLSSKGLRSGDRVIGIMGRQIETFIAAVACWRLGIIYVPVYPLFGVDAIRDRIDRSGATAAIIDSANWEAFINATRDRPESILPVIVNKNRVESHDAHGCDFWSELDEASATTEYYPTNRETPATIIFTSGTTGPPKKCVLPHGAVFAMYPYLEDCIGLRNGDGANIFSTADPGWGFGLYTMGIVPMSMGIHRTVYSGRFDADVWGRIINDYGITHIASAPSAYRRLANVKVRHQLSGCISAGENLDRATFDRIYKEWGVKIVNSYGLTELGMVLTNKGEGRLRGSPLCAEVPGFEVALLDESNNRVTPGEIGQIAVKRPEFQMSVDYEGQSDVWDSRWAGDFFKTGDLASISPEGNYTYYGRDDDVIVTSGHNLGPTEVEEVIGQLDNIIDVAVVGDDDCLRGQIVHAYVVLANSESSEESMRQRIVDAVQQKIGRYAYPRRITFVTALPRNNAGKVLRTQLSSMSNG